MACIFYDKPCVFYEVRNNIFRVPFRQRFSECFTGNFGLHFSREYSFFVHTPQANKNAPRFLRREALNFHHSELRELLSKHPRAVVLELRPQ